jgi:hypothetical protein
MTLVNMPELSGNTISERGFKISTLNCSSRVFFSALAFPSLSSEFLRKVLNVGIVAINWLAIVEKNRAVPFRFSSPLLKK